MPAPRAGRGAAREGLRAARRLDATPPGDVAIEVGDGRVGLDAPLLVATAALEITVHGWDVGQATGRPHADPRRPGPRPARRRAHVVVGADDRGPRFAPPSAPAGATPATLLAAAGRIWRDRAGPGAT